MPYDKYKAKFIKRNPFHYQMVKLNSALMT